MNSKTSYANNALASTFTVLLFFSADHTLYAMSPHTSANQPFDAEKTQKTLKTVITLLEKNDNAMPQATYCLRIIMLGVSTQLLKINTALQEHNTLHPTQPHTTQKESPFEMHTRQLQYCKEFIEKNIPLNNSPEAATRNLILTSIHDLHARNKHMQQAALTLQATSLQAKL